MNLNDLSQQLFNTLSPDKTVRTTAEQVLTNWAVSSPVNFFLQLADAAQSQPTEALILARHFLYVLQPTQTPENLSILARFYALHSIVPTNAFSTLALFLKTLIITLFPAQRRAPHTDPQSTPPSSNASRSQHPPRPSPSTASTSSSPAPSSTHRRQVPSTAPSFSSRRATSPSSSKQPSPRLPPSPSPFPPTSTPSSTSSSSASRNTPSRPRPSCSTLPRRSSRSSSRLRSGTSSSPASLAS